MIGIQSYGVVEIIIICSYVIGFVYVGPHPEEVRVAVEGDRLRISSIFHVRFAALIRQKIDLNVQLYDPFRHRRKAGSRINLDMLAPNALFNLSDEVSLVCSRRIAQKNYLVEKGLHLGE